jgi:hypothetical protein
MNEPTLHVRRNLLESIYLNGYTFRLKGGFPYETVITAKEELDADTPSFIGTSIRTKYDSILLAYNKAILNRPGDPLKYVESLDLDYHMENAWPGISEEDSIELAMNVTAIPFCTAPLGVYQLREMYYRTEGDPIKAMDLADRDMRMARDDYKRKELRKTLTKS